jgi:hypothetical protein
MGSLFRSSASTAATTTASTAQADNRIVSGDGATNFSNSNGNRLTSNTDNSLRYDNHATTNTVNNHTTTDFGSVQGSMALIASGQAQNTAMFRSAMDTGQSFFESGIGFADHALSGVLANTSAMMRSQEQVLAGYGDTQTRATNAIANAYQGASQVQAAATASIKDAFTTAKAGEQKVLVGVALAVVAIVALRK